MARQECIFCGGRPVTSEHLIPQWVNEVLGRIKPQSVTPGGKVRLNHRRLKDGEVLGDSWLADSVNLTARVVCATCNNGWMSEIENAVKAVLTPMIEDARCPLDWAAQEALARWLALKTVVTQQIGESAPNAPDWAAAFGSNRTPPASWQARIGRYTGSDWTCSVSGASHDLTLQHPSFPQPTATPSFSFTAVVGKFVGQVICVNRQGVVLPKADCFTQIWPHPLLRPGDVSIGDVRASPLWPPKLDINDELLRRCMRDPLEPRSG